MKQLVNKYDSDYRIIGITQAWIEKKGESVAAIGEKPRITTLIHFLMPTEVGYMECVYSGQDWTLEDYTPHKASVPKGESEAFRKWLGEAVKRKNYSASGLGKCLGYSRSWLWNILNGRRRLKEKDIPKLAAELGIKAETLTKHRKG